MHLDGPPTPRQLSQVMNQLFGFLLQTVHHPRPSHAQRFERLHRKSTLNVPIGTIVEDQPEPFVERPNTEEEPVWPTVEGVLTVELSNRCQAGHDDDPIAAQLEAYHGAVTAGQGVPHQVVEFVHVDEFEDAIAAADEWEPGGT